MWSRPRKGLAAWSGSTALVVKSYRLAEMLESRRGDAERAPPGARAAAERELDVAIDLVVDAGLSDKVTSLLGSQNAVQGPFFNFSTVEPTGVIGVLAPPKHALVGRALALPALVGGNAVVAAVSEPSPFVGLVLGEVCASSDVPGHDQPPERSPR